MPGTGKLAQGWEHVGDVGRYSFSGNEEDALFVNDGAGHFVDSGFQARVDLRGDGRAAAWADLDGDGDLDLVVRQLQRPKLVALRNDAPPGAHWLEVSLVGKRSNRMGVGARVRACAGGRCQTRWIRAGHGFQAQGPPVAHFGFGAGALDDLEVEVAWPSGVVQQSRVASADRRLVFTEGVAAPRALEPRPVALGAPPPGPLTLGALAAAGAPDSPLASASRSGRPTLVNLWAPWCKPCRAEAPTLAALAARCGEQVARVGLSMEPGLEQARANARELGLLWPVAAATPEQARLLDRALEGTPLPATLAFDAQGRLTGALLGEASPAALERLAPCPGRPSAPDAGRAP